MRISVSMTVLASALALSACGEAEFDAATDLVGEWDGRQTAPNLQRGVLEFHADGALSIARDNGEDDTAQWMAIGPTRITLTLSSGQVLDCRIIDNTDWLDVVCSDGAFVLELVPR